MLDQSLIFDADLIQRYARQGRRYTCYPSSRKFHAQFGEEQYRKQVVESNSDFIPLPLSLYFHLPFCNTACYFCACNKIITANRQRSLPYLQHLYREITLQAQLFDRDRQVEQIHWAGGTPTFLNPDQMYQLMQVTRQNFNMVSDGEQDFSIEIDPREVSDETFPVLSECGFNRISIGIQDVDAKVQQAINRIQPAELTKQAISQARQQGFKSIRLDLMYGLPHQSQASFDKTLDAVLTMNPDLLAIYDYAHQPKLFQLQSQLDVATLPTAAEKQLILRNTLAKLADTGYIYIGMNQFAKANDELVIAQQQGKLYRNTQGYTTHTDCDVIGLGITSISNVADCYSQNIGTENEYYQAIDQGHLPISRGLQFDDDDRVRREIINHLICNFALDFSTIEKNHFIRFHDYFRTEMIALQALRADGLIATDDQHIEVLPAGRLLINHVCMVFDTYLSEYG